MPSRGFQMTRRACIRALGTMAVPLLAPIPGRAAAREWRVTGYDIPELRTFDQAVEEFMRVRNIRCGALAVTRNGRLLLAHGYSWDDTPGGAVQPTSLFRTASISKTITATVVMRLVREGRLDLHAPVCELVALSPRAGARRDPRLDQITVLHLLQHLGGWDRERTFDPVFHDVAISRALRVRLPIHASHIVAFMSGQPVDYPPGAAFYYSNFGYLLLGRVIERVTGSTYEDAARRLLLGPLRIDGMRSGRTLPQFRADGEVTYHSALTAPTVMDGSGRSVPRPYGGYNVENLDAVGGWLASPVDLARFASMFDSVTPGWSVLDPDSIERMFAPPAIGPRPDGAYYGCGWFVRPVNGKRTIVHDGSAPGTTSSLVRRWDGLGWAVVFSQRDDRSPAAYGQEIDNLLGRAANVIQRWPAHDLFEEYLTAPAP